MGRIVFQLRNYIRAKGAIPIGPLVQCCDIQANTNGEPEIRVQLIQQTNTFIHHNEMPYTMEAELRCRNSYFVRFLGEEEKLCMAYQKIAVHAYEEDVQLTGKTYTVLTGLEAEKFSADIFVEKV